MSEPIRVLHCVVNMNRGGAETFIMNVYRNIDRNKIQFDFLTSMVGAFDDEIRQLGGKVYRIPYITQIGPIAYSKALYDFFKNHSEHEIVHSHMDKMGGLVLREAKKANKRIRIAHSHSTRNEGSLIEKLIKEYYGLYINSSSNCKLACSESAAVFLYNKLSKDACIINNGIDVNKFVFSQKTRRKIREKLNISNDVFVIGHVGRMDKAKNQSFVVDIYKKVKGKHPDSILIFIGSGELENEVKNKVNELGIGESVLFLGTRSNVNELLNVFDIMVFPSIFEGLPVTLIEAQASGLKCVISDVITKEVDISGNVEFVSLSKSASEWADVVLKHIKGYPREDMSESVTQNGYDIKNTARTLEKLYLNERR